MKIPGKEPILEEDEKGNENEEGEVFLYRYREDENGPALDNIESEEEYEMVADAF